MIYNYTISTNTIWTSFDHGFVEADSYEEAKLIAIKELTSCFDKANEAFRKCNDTKDFSLDFDVSQLQIQEATEQQLKYKPDILQK